MKFGEKVREARLQKGLTQAELAKAVGVSTRSIQSYEMSQSVPRSYGMYIKLANALSVTPEALSGIPESEVGATDFLEKAATQYGSRGKAQAKAILNQASALFAGGELSEEDELIFMREIQDIFYEAKGIAKRKYTPKKYSDKEHE